MTLIIMTATNFLSFYSFIIKGRDASLLISEGELWVLLTDLETKIIAEDIKNPPSQYKLGIY